MNKLISVIVPVYNVERFLDKCIGTIVNQTYKDLEIILVDDGSTDSSGHICDIWGERDSRIKVIHKKNAGLGFARNTGLEAVSGEYVLYFDSDDYIALNMIETLYRKMVETESDTVFCGLTRVFEDGTETQVPAAYDRTFVGDEVVDDVLLEMVGSRPQSKDDSALYMSVWHAIYSMDIIRAHNIWFPSERQIMCEDIMYHIDYLKYAQKVTYIRDCLYYYRVNPNSLTQIYDANRFARYKILATALCDALKLFLPEEKYLERVQRRLLAGARGQIIAVVNSAEKNKLQKISEICEDEWLQKILQDYPYSLNPMKHRLFNWGIKNRRLYLLFIFVSMSKFI